MSADDPAHSSQRPNRVRQVGREPYQIVPQGAHSAGVLPRLIPVRPYCTDDATRGLKIGQRDKALQRRHVQFNGPMDVTWLIFDVDHPDACFAADDGILPQPTVIAVNRNNGHAHLAYLLGRPVLKFAGARWSPLRFAAAVERGLVRRLGADRQYGGLIAKNPMHPEWRVEWLAPEPYDLSTLADCLHMHNMRPDYHWQLSEGDYGLGRNCQLFDDLRGIAYREVLTFKERGARCAEFAARLEYLAIGLNQQFATPLGRSEVCSLVRSVAKWTWGHFSPERFSEIQSWRGRRTRNRTRARMAIVDALADDDT